MRIFKNYIASLAILAIIFTSNSKKDDYNQVNRDQNLATLYFAPLIANLDDARAALRQLENGIPYCSDTAPEYVQLVLSNAAGDVMGSTCTPFSIDLVNNQLFTEEAPGVDSLDHFTVYHAADELIWLAPQESMGT